MLSEFKAFIARGNVLDLAVGIIIGGAFGTIVASMTEDVIMPLLGLILGNIDLTQRFLILGPVPADYTGAPGDYAALKAAGVPMIGYGAFLTALINFLIIAFAVFLIARYANRFFARLEAAPGGPDEQVLLLREIRDSLKAGPPPATPAP